MSNIVQYGTYDAEEAVKEKEDLAKANRKFLELKEGDTYIRILPPPAGKKSPFHTCWQHYIDFPGGKQVRFACPRQNASQPCMVCRRADELKATGNKKDFEKAKNLFARRRVFANVIDRNDPEKGVQVAAFGQTIHEQLAEIRANPEVGGDFSHPEEGFDIVIHRTGKTKNDTEYKCIPARKTTPLGNMEWLSQMFNLEAIEKIPSNDEIRKMIAEAQGNEAEEAAPAEREVGGGASPAASRGAPSRRAQDDIEDDDAPF
jgi:hypothetical protein